MSDMNEDEDDRLLAELSRAADNADPVPGHLIEAGIAAFALRTMEEELAQLVFDSATAGDLVRSDQPSRVLSFESAGLTIELEILAGDDSLRLIGQILPPRALQIDIRQPDRTTMAASDDLGRFSAVLAAATPFQLLLPFAGPGGRATATEWIAP